MNFMQKLIKNQQKSIVYSFIIFFLGFNECCVYYVCSYTRLSKMFESIHVGSKVAAKTFRFRCRSYCFFKCFLFMYVNVCILLNFCLFFVVVVVNFHFLYVFVLFLWFFLLLAIKTKGKKVDSFCSVIKIQVYNTRLRLNRGEKFKNILVMD